MTADDRFARYRHIRSCRLRDELFEGHAPLARALARRYSHRGIDDDDLFQVAALGLLKAIDRFDPDRGVGFASFAVPTVLGEIKRCFRDTSWPVHVPRRLRDLDVAVRDASSRLLQQLGRQPDLADIADELGVRVEDVIETIAARTSRQSVALERLLSDPTGALDQDLERLHDSDRVARAVGHLDQRAQLLVRLRFDEGLTQRQIAERIGVSQVHISRLLARSLEQLRIRLAPAGVAGCGMPDGADHGD